MACAPANLTVCPAPPGTQSVIPMIPPGVPPCQVCPDNMCVTPIQPGIAAMIPSERRRKCKYIQPARPKSYAPRRAFIPPDLKMADDTIYRKSYLPVENERVGAIRPIHNICLGEGLFSKDTVNKMSYMGHKDALPACPILPCNHKLLGEGPMQDITTQKHDYVCKPSTKRVTIKPPANLCNSDCPLSDKTTNRLSYMPVDTLKSKVQPFYPCPALEKACGPFETNTVQRMSYRPCEPPEPVDMPWAAKKTFTPPVLPMADNTVHKLSYKLPGTYVECDDNDPDCIPCPEPPCDPNANQRGMGCCMPCCCPKASC